MADPDKTDNFCDADNDVSDRKRSLSDVSESRSTPPKCKRHCSSSESSNEHSTPQAQKSFGTESDSDEDSLSIHIKQLTKMTSIELPPTLCQWERKHIENLNISVVYAPILRPLDLIQSGEINNREETEKIDELKKYVQKSPIMTNLRSLDHLYTSFSDLSSENLWEMAPNDDEKISMIPTWLPERHMTWFYRFHCQAQHFSNQLYLTLKRRENGCNIHKSHMQALFEAFASMFGLKSGLSSAPCVDIDTKRIMEWDVSGAADIVFPCKMYSPHQVVKQGTQHPSVVAVCKVQRDGPQMNQCDLQLNNRIQKKVKSDIVVSSPTSSEASLHQMPQHLDERIVGQHGGELLFHYPDTIKRGKICGLIVQETQVTFTMLEMSKDQYKDIVDGNIRRGSEDRPTLKFSKPYDYLKTEDREYVIEAFIKLAMLQRLII
ncbi:hypothetical protein FSP39_015928 [Pinctada imbricata]|uniref:Uncharacterized protein n=1 Tax=Pinctada imbricata TaxID=66713 RepID=A0AA89C6N7_PINIB|nr:hypothetical protein FSP39_015928 [Pinctada imbricata]